MSQQFTLKVSDRVVNNAQYAAAHGSRDIEEILSSWLEKLAGELPVDELPDDEVLKLTRLRLSGEQEKKMNELLLLNQENALSDQKGRELDELMRIYERGLLRKAQALRVAVQRGLREPLQS